MMAKKEVSIKAIEKEVALIKVKAKEDAEEEEVVEMDNFSGRNSKLHSN